MKFNQCPLLTQTVARSEGSLSEQVHRPSVNHQPEISDTRVELGATLARRLSDSVLHHQKPPPLRPQLAAPIKSFTGEWKEHISQKMTRPRTPPIYLCTA